MSRQSRSYIALSADLDDVFNYVVSVNYDGCISLLNPAGEEALLCFSSKVLSKVAYSGMEAQEAIAVMKSHKWRFRFSSDEPVDARETSISYQDFCAIAAGGQAVETAEVPEETEEQPLQETLPEEEQRPDVSEDTVAVETSDQLPEESDQQPAEEAAEDITVPAEGVVQDSVMAGPDVEPQQEPITQSLDDEVLLKLQTAFTRHFSKDADVLFAALILDDIRLDTLGGNRSQIFNAEVINAWSVLLDDSIDMFNRMANPAGTDGKKDVLDQAIINCKNMKIIIKHIPDTGVHLAALMPPDISPAFMIADLDEFITVVRDLL